MSKEKWMQEAVRKPGALTAQAKRAGKSMSEFCKSPKTTQAKRRCNLRKVFKRYGGRGGRKARR